MVTYRQRGSAALFALASVAACSLGCQACAETPSPQRTPGTAERAPQGRTKAPAPKQSLSTPGSADAPGGALAAPQAPQAAPQSEAGKGTAPRLVRRKNAMPAYGGSLPAARGHRWAILRLASTERSLALYRPARHAPHPPLLIVLHGTNNGAREAISDSGAQELAEREGLVVIAPQALALPVGDWDHHQPKDRYFRTYPHLQAKGNPDLRLLLAVIAAAHKAYGIDRERVYLLGFSNGGFFATLAAAALSDRIAGFAAFSAGLVRCPKTESCRFKAGEANAKAGCASWRKDPSYCRCGVAAKPIDPAREGPLPAAYLSHAPADETVSVAYSCELAAALRRAGTSVELALPPGGHYWPPAAASQAWRFLRHHRLRPMTAGAR